jgi:plastocyanin
MLRRHWLLVLAAPVLLGACSSGGGSNAALDLAPSPALTATATASSAPGTAAHATPSASPARSVSPAATHSTSASMGTHSSSPRPATTHPQAHSPSPKPTKTQSSSYVIHTHDYYFSPASLSVPVGSSVQVVNAGPSSHTWTSGSAPVHRGPFDSGNLEQGQTYTYTFHSSGSFSFFCKYHYSSGMKGHITVQ